MFNDNQSSTNDDGEQALNAALAEIDRAYGKLETIINRRLRSINAKTGKKNMIIRSGLQGLAQLIGSSQSSDRTVFNPNSQKNNNFQPSDGQWLADLVAQIARSQSRNS